MEFEITKESDVAMQQQKMEIESAIDVANRYPRDIKKVAVNVLAFATMTKATAEEMFYVKPVDNKGTMATGPSIRFAEIVATQYRNLKFGVRVLEIGQDRVKVQGVCMDLENNVSFTSEKTRSIKTKTGNRYGANMIDTTIDAVGAIALRTAIFKCVPIAAFAQELEQIKLFAKQEAKKEMPIEEQIEKTVKFLNKKGITTDAVLNVLKAESVEAISDDGYTTLKGIINADKDGETTLAEAFTPVEKEEKKTAAKTAAQKIKEDLFDEKK